MRGRGRIFQRGNLLWIAYYLRGEEYRESTGTNDRKQAERFLRRRLDEVGADRMGAKRFVAPRHERMIVAELLDGLKADYQLRGKWGERAASTVKMVHQVFGHIRAIELSAEDIAAFQLELREKGYRDATINRFCQVLGQSFKLAIERRQLASAPVIRHLSEADNARTGFFTEAEIRRVISHLPDHLQDFTLFAYISGMRRGEVQSLRWSDVHSDTITLRAAESKNGEGRTIPLEGELADLIERRRNARQVQRGGTIVLAEHIFHRDGEPIASFRKAWASACRFAGVPGRLFHDLRRCAARNLLAAGVPQAVAMKITGHKTDSMYRRYAIITPDQQREALRRAESYRRLQVEATQKVETLTPRTGTIN
jgi:integrase